MAAIETFVSASRLALIFLASAIISCTAVQAEEDISALVTICAGCHGEKGIPQDKTTPVIWGQNEGYMYLQLRDFQKGTRKNEQMQPIVKDLERPVIRALAAHFTKLDWPNLGQPEAPAAVEKKAKSVSVAMSCTVCHQGEYEGDGTTGRVAGQSLEYLNKTAQDFRTGARANNPGMANVFRSMEEDDVKAINQYLAGLRLQPSAGRR